MYAYELHKIQEAELLRRAELERVVRQARRARRAARRSGRQEDEGAVSTFRNRFVHAA
ncbi:hypothetical protein [Streptomyces sp. NBC_01800]|uniref:hypothetical protein n=1 Tax=unclassified Streptomyces TaxID=2593676 RepID=UPI002DD8121A|nr:hypothetical protein [Streptomyces sp. NBC_01800]WSA70752.1 hypothetical protein OIE65_29395 [Streptomyces sp. NBC_01800]WSA79250.1 hypothetical protein OG930_28720 [Streptomyces sp. NBC_01799]